MGYGVKRTRKGKANTQKSESRIIDFNVSVRKHTHTHEVKKQKWKKNGLTEKKEDKQWWWSKS